jgi:hypothetical protein
MPMASYNINKNCRQSLIQKKWMCVSYLKHTLLSNPTSSLGAINYIIPSTLKILLGEEAVIINENIHHHEETKYETEGIQATAVRIKASVTKA